MLAGSRSGIRESLKRQGLHSLAQFVVHASGIILRAEGEEEEEKFSPACSITGTWAGPGAGHLHL